MPTENVYHKLAQMLADGDTVAVATIVDVKGSVPREVGAKMVIHPLGRHVGTVGGGCGEADVIRAAVGVMQTGHPVTVRVDLTEDISMQALGVCGGILDVFVEQVGPAPASPQTTSPDAPASAASDAGAAPAATAVPAQMAGEAADRASGPVSAADRIAAVEDSVAARLPVALVKVVGGPVAGREAVVWLDRPPLGRLGLAASVEERVFADARQVLAERQHRLLRYPDEEGLAVFVEVQRRTPELLIVGAGHIALPLAQMAAICDFAVTVIDDRPQYANQARFPTAHKVFAAPLRETVRDLPLDLDSFVVLVTRGHSQDVECLLELLDRPLGYIGMIGSQRRVDAVFKLLAEEKGIDPTKFDRVYSPIGVDIAAQTPAEIAVCIMAEIINVLRGGPAPSLADKRRTRDKARRERKALAR